MAFIELQPGEVHVWMANLDAPPTQVVAYERLLNPDEHERAARLRLEHLRVRFVTGRGILRRLLGNYLQKAPEQVAFTYGPHGKPFLTMAKGAAPFAFNLAHSQNVAVYAFALADRIGVDIEQMREVIERDQIAERFFSLRERRMLAALPAQQREEAFFLCWTRKEAYLKALGAGITLPLDQFSVSLTPGAPAALLETALTDPGNESGGAPWTLLSFIPAPQHCAAVAIEGSDWLLHCRQY